LPTLIPYLGFAQQHNLYGDATVKETLFWARPLDFFRVFSHNLVFGGNGVNCTNDSSGLNPGLGAGACANQGASSATLKTDAGTPLFVGKVATDDVNTSDSTGTATYPGVPATFDWLGFENRFRGWGKDGSAFPNDNNRNDFVSGSGRIWDWRLMTTDTVARNKSYDATSGNGAFTPGATCPPAVHGNVTITDAQTSPNTFLVNAREVYGDAIGDDNGLCENAEACIYAPNFGAYQGEGALTAACLFENGAVTGVTMYAYVTNGQAP
jgi:hypothetical protein